VQDDVQSTGEKHTRRNSESCTKVSIVESLELCGGTGLFCFLAWVLLSQLRTCRVQANSSNPVPSPRRNLPPLQEGRNIKCVVKRVRVDFDKDINDASEALQEAKSLIRLDVHPHVVTYMDTWLHRCGFHRWMLESINEGWLAWTRRCTKSRHKYILVSIYRGCLTRARFCTQGNARVSLQPNRE
jgi:hypothetical protein